jgi:biopolymer transport protein TolR
MAMLPSRASGRRRAPMAEINVTPLVDVMLVLLIIFMVTAPLLTAGVPVQLPDSRAKALPQDDKPVEVSLDATGALFIDKDKVSDDAFVARLDRLAALPKPPQVFLRADTHLDYGRVMRVMGDLNHAGLNRVSLITTPDENGR